MLAERTNTRSHARGEDLYLRTGGGCFLIFGMCSFLLSEVRQATQQTSTTTSLLVSVVSLLAQHDRWSVDALIFRGRKPYTFVSQKLEWSVVAASNLSTMLRIYAHTLD